MSANRFDRNFCLALGTDAQLKHLFTTANLCFRPNSSMRQSICSRILWDGGSSSKTVSVILFLQKGFSLAPGSKSLVHEGQQTLDCIDRGLLQWQPLEAQQLCCLGVIDLKDLILWREVPSFDSLSWQLILQLREILPHNLQQILV